jgi:thymidylate kinase
MEYQRRMEEVFQAFRQRYPFESIDANRPAAAIQHDLRVRLMTLLERHSVSGRGTALA